MDGVNGNNWDTGQGAVMVFSPAMGLMSMNPEARNFLGLSIQDLEGPLELSRICAGGSFKRLEKQIHSIASGARPGSQLGITLKHGQGHALSCKAQLKPLVSGGRDIMGVVISLETGADETGPRGLTYLSRMDHQRILDRLPQGVFSIDTHWKIQSFNRRAEEMTGLKQEDVVGQYCWQVFKAGGCRSDCPFERIFQEGSGQECQEMSVVGRDGEVKKFFSIAAPLEDDKGRLMGGIQTFLSPDPGSITPEFIFPDAFEGMVGKSPAMTAIFHRLQDIAQSPSNVLITGESGTGKELVARAIHRLSRVGTGPFMAVNCSALAESLLESELFGHEKGAYTGADQARMGRFELAAKGSLFLDEIGEMKPGLQVKLLRVLDHREFERVGSGDSVKLTARIIAATHRDLEAGQASGEFRRDLFYRLRTIPIHLPPLRERREDISLLVKYFIAKFNHKYGKNVRMLDPAVMATFMAHDWPGNIRELAQVMENAFVFVRGPIIFPRYLPQDMGPASDLGLELAGAGKTLAVREKARIIKALEKTGQKRLEAAALLGMSRSSLWRKMKQYGLLN